MSDLYIFGVQSSSKSKVDVSSATVTLNTSPIYDGTEKMQSVSSVVLDGKTLINGTDYIVTDNIAISAGSYTLSIIGIGNYCGVATKSWTLKGIGQINVEPASVEIIGAGSVSVVAISKTGDGTLGVSTNNSNVATAYLSTQVYNTFSAVNVRTGPTSSYDLLGKTVAGTQYVYLGETSGRWHKIFFNNKIGWASVGASGQYGELIDAASPSLVVNAVASGNTSITVTLSATDTFAGNSKNIGVEVTILSATLSDNTPAQIQAAAQAGIASSLWSVGDRTAPISIGAVGDGFSGTTACAFILGFNHNSSKEGSGIHFQFGKTTSGTDIAFVTSGTLFNMNNTYLNNGGWNGSRMKTTICPAFLSALPSAWQNVISTCTKYTDNTGGGSNTASYVTATTDGKIWLLAEFEVYGKQTWANSAEQNYQAQYDYYKNGNSDVKYEHSSTSEACYWWLRSPWASESSSFCLVSCIGGVTGSSSNSSFGFAPGFKVA